MAGPEPGEQLEDQRPETLLDRIGIGFVAGRLVRNRIGQKGVTQRVLKFKFAGGHEVCGSLGLPGPQHPFSHELAPGPDQRLAKSDLILAQVAPEDADRSLERAGIENRLKRVFLEPFVDRDIDGKLLAAGTCGISSHNSSIVVANLLVSLSVPGTPYLVLDQFRGPVPGTPYLTAWANFWKSRRERACQ